MISPCRSPCPTTCPCTSSRSPTFAIIDSLSNIGDVGHKDSAMKTARFSAADEAIDRGLDQLLTLFCGEHAGQREAVHDQPVQRQIEQLHGLFVAGQSGVEVIAHVE